MELVSKIIKKTIFWIAAPPENSPIAKGLVPTFTGAGVSLVEELESWIRLASVTVGLIIGCITLYRTINKAIAERKQEKAK